MSTRPETCASCGFDAAVYTRSDLLGTLRALTPIWRSMTAEIDPAALDTRPEAGVWSVSEYAAHSRDVTGAMDFLLTLTLEQDHPVLDPAPDPPDPAVTGSIADVLGQFDRRVTKLHRRASDMTRTDWDRLLTVGDATADARWLVGHAVHDATHHLHDAGRILHRVGAGVPHQRGRIAQINTSRGGVPKSPEPHVVVDRSGVVGDVQAERKHHGRPLQALSLWSIEVIDALRAEGHSVRAGAAGENFTIAGIDWDAMRPGVRIGLGDVLAEISAFATPCAKNAQWFADRDYRRIDHDRHPGWSRAYAWVLQGGEVAAGDAVVVEP